MIVSASTPRLVSSRFTSFHSSRLTLLQGQNTLLTDLPVCRRPTPASSLPTSALAARVLGIGAAFTPEPRHPARGGKHSLPFIPAAIQAERGTLPGICSYTPSRRQEVCKKMKRLQNDCNSSSAYSALWASVIKTRLSSLSKQQSR